MKLQLSPVSDYKFRMHDPYPFNVQIFWLDVTSDLKMSEWNSIDEDLH